MKISREWLSDFVDWIEHDPAVVADKLTRSTGEVDDVTLQGKYLDGVVVGKVTNLSKHPQADRLSVCDIETEQGTKHVVCGGTNLKDGMLVAFAHVGATVLAAGKEEVTLTRVKIRGEESEGMICAPEEVELQHIFPSKPEDGARPIADLSAHGFSVGTALREALSMTDVVFHIDNHAITNRPDLFSHIGVARECVALGLATWKKRNETPVPSFIKKDAGFAVRNDVPDLVPAYVSCLLHVDGTAETPDWMKKRLEATGWRSINLVVDITNYVLMETGMPLHAFDADDFQGDIVIRSAKKGESITTLDDVRRPLPEGAVVIADDDGIFDLFGVMGGLRTSNKPTTKRIFLQAGVINAVSVRRTMIAMAHRTDAGTVYEKGVTLSTAEAGLARAVELFTTLLPKTSVASKAIGWGTSVPKKPIDIQATLFADLTGADITPKTAEKILKNLGFTVQTSGANMSVTAPPWRTDIAFKQDLIEEVSRIYGYANVPPAMPTASIVPPERDVRMNMLRDALKDEGWYELLHLAFVSPALLKKAGLDPTKAAAIENPLGEELSLMRTSLLPAMLDTVAREVKKGDASHLRAFEYGRVFTDGKQPEHLCLVVAAKGKTTLKDEPVLLAKADLTSAFAAVGYMLTFESTKKDLPPFAHAGRSAVVMHDGKKIGLVTEVLPAVAKSFDLPSRTAVAWVDWETLKATEPNIRIFKPLPAFPSIEFDETVPVPKTAFATLVTKLKNFDALLSDVRIADLYENADTRTVTLHFTYRASDRTLTQEEVEKVHARVIAELKKA